ncbi:hypothetical protein ACWGS5_25420 [Streptomyces albidoflavus]|uniref:hypothetical protein n=1 Tax=Streptomyces TaxID=1883 RepID=UPI000AEB6869
MFTIGDFARHGRVSVRMPRHYDATGLLRPAHVDPANGCRATSAACRPSNRRPPSSTTARRTPYSPPPRS